MNKSISEADSNRPRAADPASNAAVVTEEGLVAIPPGILHRFGLTAGTQIEFRDDGDAIRLVVRRRPKLSDPAVGFGLIKVPSSGRPRRLEDFDPASLTRGVDL